MVDQQARPFKDLDDRERAILHRAMVGQWNSDDLIHSLANAEAEVARLRGALEEISGALTVGAYWNGFNGPDAFEDADHAAGWAIDRARAALGESSPVPLPGTEEVGRDEEPAT